MSSPHRIDRVNGKPPTSSWKNEDGGDGKPQPDVVDNCDVNNSTKPLIPSMSATGADVTTARIPSGALWKSFEQLLPSFLPSAGFMLKSFLGVTVSLYILNQKHLLPKPLSRIVSKCLFWPTLPITVVRRLGSWETVIDGTVIMGGAPFGFAKIPEKLYEQYGVSWALLRLPS